MEREDVWVHTIDYPFLHEFYKSYLMSETKMIIQPDAQDNDI